MPISTPKLVLTALSTILTGAAAAELPPIVITAGRVAESVEETLYSTSTVDREAIEKLQPRDVGEILERQPGIQIGRNGGPGQTTSAFIRGAASDHTLVLIDGVPVNSGTVGSPALQHLMPDVIDRVEVVRGPASTLYGSGAIGGVVQIFTLGGKTGRRAQIVAGGGSESSRNLSGRVAYGEAGLFANLSLSHRDTDGYALRPSLSPVDRGYENTSLNGAIGGTIGDVDIELSYLRSSGLVEYIDFFGNAVDQDTENSVARVVLDYAPGGAWRSRLMLGRARDDIDENQSDDFAQTERDYVDWQNTLAFGDHQTLVAGFSADWTDTELLSFGSGYNERIRSLEYYLQDTIEIGETRLQLGGRAIDNEQYGSHTTWNLAVGQRLNESTRVHASIGTAFRAPSANDLYGFGGDPDFDPETSISAEIGVRHRLTPRNDMRLVAFWTEIEDLIETNPVTFITEQTEEARITGVEIGYAHRSANGSWSLDYTYMDPKNRDVDQTLARRARHTLDASIGFDRASWWGEALLRYQSERRDSRFSSTMLDAYTTVDIAAGYRFSSSLSVVARLRNVFDENYELAATYPAQGRFVGLELRYRYEAD